MILVMKKTEESFGERLIKLRKQRGFSQAVLAEQIGVSARMLCYYERASRRPPADLLPKIASVLNISIDELLGTKEIHLDGRTVDARLLRKLETMKDLPADDRRLVLQMIDSLAVKNAVAH